MIILGVVCLIEQVKRWFVSCGAGRVGRAGMRVQPIVGRTRNPRVLLYRLRFVSRFGKLRHHNNARMVRMKAEDCSNSSRRSTAIRKGGTQAIRTYVRTYVRTHARTYVRMYVRPYVRTYVQERPKETWSRSYDQSESYSEPNSVVRTYVRT